MPLRGDRGALSGVRTRSVTPEEPPRSSWLLPDGVGAYTTEGFRLIPPDPWRGVQGRGNVIDELYYAVMEDRAVTHSGRWAKATMEVCLAMLESARTHREVTLEHQVPIGPDRLPVTYLRTVCTVGRPRSPRWDRLDPKSEH